MNTHRPPGKLLALGAATAQVTAQVTAQATVQAAGLVKALSPEGLVQAINPQRAFEAVRKFKAARQRRNDARSGVQLRLATAADLAALAALHSLCGLAPAAPRAGDGSPTDALPQPLGQAWATVTQAGAQIWLAEKEGALLGALTLYLLPLLAHGGSRAGWVDDLVVHPGAHHLSIPRRLIAQATEVAIASGAHKLALSPRRKAARERGARAPAEGFVETLEYSRHGRSAELPPTPEGAR